MSTPPQRIQGSKSVPDLERQTNIALERINGQLGTGGGTSASGLAALQEQINELKNLSGGFADIGGTGAGSPGPNPSDGTVETDGVTITGDGVNFPIALVTPVTIPDGGTGTATPALVAGPNITITGSWPDNTIAGNLVDVTVAFSTPYGVAATDYFIAGNATASADQIINLPVATGTGRVLIVKKIDANAHNVVVTAAATENIDGSGTVTLSSQYQAVTIVDMGLGVWSAIGAYP